MGKVNGQIKGYPSPQEFATSAALIQAAYDKIQQANKDVTKDLNKANATSKSLNTQLGNVRKAL